METQTKKKVGYLRTDNGGEYTSEQFLQFCRAEGTTHHFTVPGTPQQNGVSERLNRTLMDRSRSMMSHARLPQVFWAEAVNTAAYLVNFSPHSAILFKTPFEMWHGREPDYSVLRIFGCDAYAHVPSIGRSKLDPRAKKCIFLGYQP